MPVKVADLSISEFVFCVNVSSTTLAVNLSLIHWLRLPGASSRMIIRTGLWQQFSRGPLTRGQLPKVHLKKFLNFGA